MRERLARPAMLKNKIPNGRKRRADNHSVMDLPSVDGAQLLVDGHLKSTILGRKELLDALRRRHPR